MKHMRIIYVVAIFFNAALLLADSQEKNLISNGNFEKGTKGWAYETWKKVSNPGRLETTSPFEGKHSYLMYCKNDRTNRIYFNHIYIAADKSYILSMHLKCVDVPAGDVKVKMLCWKSEKSKNKVIGWVNLPPASGCNSLIKTGGMYDWKKFTVTLAPACFQQGVDFVTLYIERKNNSAGKLYIDDVEMLEKSK